MLIALKFDNMVLVGAMLLNSSRAMIRITTCLLTNLLAWKI
jgi:hypothetical protein